MMYKCPICGLRLCPDGSCLEGCIEAGLKVWVYEMSFKPHPDNPPIEVGLIFDDMNKNEATKLILDHYGNALDHIVLLKYVEYTNLSNNYEYKILKV